MGDGCRVMGDGWRGEGVGCRVNGEGWNRKGRLFWRVDVDGGDTQVSGLIFSLFFISGSTFQQNHPGHLSCGCHHTVDSGDSEVHIPRSS